MKPPLGVQLNRAHPLSRGLVGCWLLNEGGGLNVRDLSGVNSSGVLTNGPTWRAGRSGCALNLDGVDDYISIPHSTSLNLTAQASVSFWMYVTSAPANFTAFLNKGYDGSVVPFFFDLRKNLPGDPGTPYFLTWARFGIGGGVGTISTVDFSLSTNQNKWWHVVGTFNTNTGWNLYLNGVLEATNATSGGDLPTSTKSVLVGAFDNNGTISRNTPAIMDDVRIWNRTLTASEVRQLYLDPYGVMSAPRTRVWSVPTTTSILFRRTSGMRSGSRSVRS